jgi:thiol:disulfide interchange protein DsbD
MGLTMGLVAAPCIGPVVIGLLVYVGSERELSRGLLLFLSLGLGMGLPYVGLAAVAGSLGRLPRAGEWLAWVDRLFGVLLLGMALYFVSPLLSDAVVRAVVPVFVAGAGLYLGFLEPAGRSPRAFLLARRAAGSLVLVVALGLGLSAAKPGGGVHWEPLTPESLDTAIAASRPAVVEFSADWCLPCVEMKHSTFVDPDVTRQANQFSMLRADVTEGSELNDRLLEQFGVRGVPTIIFYDRAGVETDRAVGFVDAERFSSMMRRAAAPPGGEGPLLPSREGI